MRIRFAIFMLLVLFSSNRMQAALIWSEAVNGTFSTNNLSPTNLNVLPIGTSTVSGSVAGTNIDIFRIEIPVGARLDKIILAGYVPGDSVAFMAVDSATTFPFTRQQMNSTNPYPDETQFIGGSTFGIGNATVGVTDLLEPTHIGGRFIGRQPTPEQTTATPYGSLPAGPYTFYIQQTGPLTAYTLDFVVVPEPHSICLLTIAGLLASRRRHRTIA